MTQAARSLFVAFIRHKGLSTFEKEIPEKKLKNVYFCKKIRGKNIAAVYFGK